MTTPGNARPLVFAAALILIAAVSACAPNPTPYQPAAATRYGYAEQQIEQNRFRVSFTGNSDTPRQWVENGLLYRAAELTKSMGYDYFVVVTQETEPNTRYLSTFEGFGGRGFYHRSWIGPEFATAETQAITTYTAYADIVMMKGHKDANDVKALSADEVLSKLGPAIYRGGPVKRTW